MNAKEVLEATTHYEALGLPIQLASYTEVRAAYKQRALLVHPDKQAAANHEDAHKAFQRISVAFETLASEASQQMYYRSLPSRVRKSSPEDETRDKAAGSSSSSSAAAAAAGETVKRSRRKRDREWWELIDIDAIDEELSAFDRDLKEEIERQRELADQKAKAKKARQENIEQAHRARLQSDLQRRAESGKLEANTAAWKSFTKRPSSKNV